MKSVYDPQFLLDVGKAKAYLNELVDAVAGLTTHTNIKDTITIHTPISDIYTNAKGQAVVVHPDGTETVLSTDLNRTLVQDSDGNQYVVTSDGTVMGLDLHHNTLMLIYKELSNKKGKGFISCHPNKLIIRAMQKRSSKKYKTNDIIESLELISDFQDSLRRRNDRLRKNLDKRTYQEYIKMKKDLKMKYKKDIYLYSLIRQIPSAIWLQEYIFSVISGLLYLFTYLLEYRIITHFPVFFIFLDEWKFWELFLLVMRIIIIISIVIFVFRLMTKEKKLSTSIAKVQKALEECI
jgi:hypothetical protein